MRGGAAASVGAAAGAGAPALGLGVAGAGPAAATGIVFQSRERGAAGPPISCGPAAAVARRVWVGPRRGGGGPRGREFSGGRGRGGRQIRRSRGPGGGGGPRAGPC